MKKYAYMAALRLSFYFKDRANSSFFEKYSRLLKSDIDKEFLEKMEASYEFHDKGYTKTQSKIFELCAQNPIALTCFELAVLCYMDSRALEILDYVTCHQRGITVELGARVYYPNDEIISHVEEMKQASWILNLILYSKKDGKDMLYQEYECDTFLALLLTEERAELEEVEMFLYEYQDNMFPSILYEKQIEEIASRAEIYNGYYGKTPIIHIIGNKQSGKKFVSKRIAYYLEKNFIYFDLDILLYKQSTNYIEKLIRYAYLMDTGICLHNINHSNYKELKFKLKNLLYSIAEYGIPVMLLSDDKVNLFHETELTVFPLIIEEMTRAQRYEVWNAFSEIFFFEYSIPCDVLSMRIKSSIGVIYRIFQYMLDNPDLEKTEENFSKAYRLICMGNQGRAYQLHRTTEYTLEDLIISQESKEILKDICNQVFYRRKVFDEYGYGKKYPYGTAVSVLFTGAPGTGKTMAAYVLANILGMELYQVDMSQIVDKYIGETEKKLKEVFDIASQNNMILFLDEADALIGKRSETKEAKDKYANVEVAYILQKIEEYDGVVIMASNLKNNIDSAVMRRIRYEVKFEIPTLEIREKIWKSVFDTNLPKEDINYNYLAEQFELSGASIKNIALNAIFKAVSEDSPVTMRHILSAVKNENTKNGKAFFPDEYGEYVSFLM